MWGVAISKIQAINTVKLTRVQLSPFSGWSWNSGTTTVKSKRFSVCLITLQRTPTQIDVHHPGITATQRSHVWSSPMADKTQPLQDAVSLKGIPRLLTGNGLKFASVLVPNTKLADVISTKIIVMLQLVGL